MASEAGLAAGEPDDLQRCLDLLRELEWCFYGRCPSCENLHPDGAHRFHGHFRHADDCKLARLIGSKLRGEVFSCDCYSSGKFCSGEPLYDGKPHEAP